MEKSAQKVFDRADIVRDVRFGDLSGFVGNGEFMCEEGEHTGKPCAAQQERSALLSTTSRERRARALIIAQVDRPSE